MRHSARWMIKEDDRILECLDEEGWASPEQLASELEISPAHACDRLDMLRYAGLVDRVWSDVFELTKWGRLYLDGDLDARHQPTPTRDRSL